MFDKALKLLTKEKAVKLLEKALKLPTRKDAADSFGEKANRSIYLVFARFLTSGI